MFVYGDVVMLRIGRYWPWKTVTVSSHLHIPVRPLLLHRVALVSFRLYVSAKFGQLARIFWAKGLPPPLAKNFPYAYVYAQLLLLTLILSAVGVNWRKTDTFGHNETQLINGGRYEIGYFRVLANLVNISSICISVAFHLASLWNRDLKHLGNGLLKIVWQPNQ